MDYVPSTTARMDASLQACCHIFLEALFLFLSGLLLFLAAGTRILSALATLLLACCSLALWSFTAWQTGLEWIGGRLAIAHQKLKETR